MGQKGCHIVQVGRPWVPTTQMGPLQGGVNGGGDVENRGRGGS